MSRAPALSAGHASSGVRMPEVFAAASGLSTSSSRPSRDHESPVMSVKETAAYLRRSVATVYVMLGAGQLQAVKDGARTFILRSSVEQHLRSLRPAVIQPSKRYAGAKEPA